MRSRRCFRPDFNNIFFVNSGSEAAETALKIARAYHVARGSAERVWLIGRERGYHGVNFGGISVGGIPTTKPPLVRCCRKSTTFATLTIPTQRLLARPAGAWRRVRGRPATNHRRHGAEKIAAVIVEPMAGSTGVLPPPKGYLERLRDICDEHGILLIFDEVITGFGRLGAPFAAQRFDVRRT